MADTLTAMYECAICSRSYSQAEYASLCMENHFSYTKTKTWLKQEPGPSKHFDSFQEKKIQSIFVSEEPPSISPARLESQRTTIVWSEEATVCLIEFMKENYEALNKRGAKRSKFYKNLIEILKCYFDGATLSKTQVENRWKYLLNKFKTYLKHRHQTGSGYKQPPPHYELLASFLLERPSINPTNTQSCGLPSTSRPTCEEQKKMPCEIKDQGKHTLNDTVDDPQDCALSPPQPQKKIRKRPASLSHRLESTLREIKDEIKTTNELFGRSTAAMENALELSKKHGERKDQHSEEFLVLFREYISRLSPPE